MAWTQGAGDWGRLAAVVPSCNPPVGAGWGGALVYSPGSAAGSGAGESGVCGVWPPIATMRSIARRARWAISGSTVIRCCMNRNASRTFGNVVTFISEFGLLEITPDTPSRVVINERTGTIVAGHNVKISTVAVTHGNLAIVTTNEPIVSQPNSFSRGKTKVLQRGQVGVTEQGNIVRVLEENMTVGDLARALNALGASPRDLIVIFQALKRLGALHAELVFM